MQICRCKTIFLVGKQLYEWWKQIIMNVLKFKESFHFKLLFKQYVLDFIWIYFGIDAH